MLLAVFLVSSLSLASTPVPRAGSSVPCHECPQTVWYVNAASPANGPGDSWATAFRRLPTAIKAAASGDCIWVAQGIYTPTQSLNRSKSFKIDKVLRIYGGFAGNELCFSNRLGNFWGTVLSGDIGQLGDPSDNSYTVVDMSGPTVVGQNLGLVLDGFLIKGAMNVAPGNGAGGGVFASVGSVLHLENCFVRRNEAVLGGGLNVEGANVTIRNTGISRNVADHGAGIYAKGGVYRIFNASFRRNRARKNGGGAYLAGMGPKTVSLWANVLFESNQAKRGGAMYLKSGVITQPPLPWIQPGRAHLVGCTLTRNLGSVRGSALMVLDHPILVSLDGVLDAENTVIWNNGGPKPEIIGLQSTNIIHSTVPATSVFAGGLNLAVDPLLLPPNFRLASGSPAIDAGHLLSILPDLLDLDDDGDVSEPTPQDWQLRPRVQGPGVDMGASEY